MNRIMQKPTDWRISEAAESIGAKWSGPDIIFSSTFKIDSREIDPGDIFWALPGSRTDGHLHLEEVLDRGAKALVINPARTGQILDRIIGENVPVIMTDSTVRSLRGLSLNRLEMLKLDLTFGITGTVGKTTTREMIKTIAQKTEGVHSARRSFNTWIGCALTVLEAPLDTRVLILEMGTNHPGEIREMAEMFKPDYGIISEIGAGHLEGLKDERGVLEAKMELANCGSINWLSYNYDNSLLRSAVGGLSDKIFKIPIGRTSTIYRLDHTSFEFQKNRPFLKIVLKTPSGRRILKTSLFGDHNAYAVAFAMAAGDILGVDANDQIEALELFEALPGRGGVSQTPSGVTVINETYNANPLSMRQALVTLSKCYPEGRKLAVLGGMGELGEESVKFHREMVPYFRNFEQVFLFGEQWARSVFPDIPDNCRFYDDISKLSENLQGSVFRGDLVLLKGSRYYRMERVLEALNDR